MEVYEKTHAKWITNFNSIFSAIFIVTDHQLVYYSHINYDSAFSILEAVIKAAQLALQSLEVGSELIRVTTT